MIEQGKKRFSAIDFKNVGDGHLPFKDHEFDAAFSSFVFLEMGDSAEIIKSLKELRRVMKKGAPLIVVAISKNVYEYRKYNVVASRTNFSENDALVRGQKGKLQLKSLDFPFEDYFWSDTDYQSFFNEAGFKSVTLYSPLGTKEDEADLNITWLSETPGFTHFGLSCSVTGLGFCAQSAPIV